MDPWRGPSEPIETQAQAQEFGWNVHSLDAAREQREIDAWGEPVKQGGATLEHIVMTLGDILDGQSSDWSPDGAA